MPSAAAASAESDTGLSHALRPRHVTMISLGGIIGAGLFVGSSTTIRAVGPLAAVSYLAAGLIVVMVMRMIGEMAVATAERRSFVELARTGLGNWAGFTCGWLYWFFWIIVVGAEAIAGANLLQPIVPLPIWALSSVLILLMTATNLFSVRSFGEFELWLSSLKVAAIVLFIALAAAAILGLLPTRIAVHDNLFGHGGLAPHGVGAVLGSVPVVIFSLVGAEIATITAAESDSSGAAIARSIRTLITRILIFYVFSVALLVCIVPWDTIRLGTSPFLAAMTAMRIPGALVTIRLVVFVAVVSCLNSGLYIVSRVAFELAARGDAPKVFGRLSIRRVPMIALLAGTLGGLAASFASVLSPGGVFNFLLNASGAIILFVYALLAAAEIRLRRKLDRAGIRVEVKMWLFPWASYATIAAILAVLASMTLSQSQRPQILASLATLALVLGAYVCARQLR
jgi:GABA permease